MSHWGCGYADGSVGLGPSAARILHGEGTIFNGRTKSIRRDDCFRWNWETRDVRESPLLAKDARSGALTVVFVGLCGAAKSRALSKRCRSQNQPLAAPR